MSAIEKAALGLAAIAPLTAAWNPSTTPFLFSGSANTSVPMQSSAITTPRADSTFTVTALSGVTSLICQIQATNDTSTALGGGGVAWTTIGTVYLTAPGVAQVPVALPYLAIRANVTSISGGAAAASMTAGQVPLGGSAGYALVNPQLTGVPAPTAYTLGQTGMPVILPSSGTIGNNGALTLATALPAVFPNCWMYFPTGAIASGSVAGVYYAQMSSTTVGTIFNHFLSVGLPYIPSAPVSFSTTGPGAYTQTTASNPQLVALPIIAGSLGNNGVLRYKGAYIRPNTANTQTYTIYLGGTQIAFLSAVSQAFVGFERSLRNVASQSTQMSIVTSTNVATDVSVNGSPVAFLSINTAATQNLVFTAYIANAADYAILAGFDASILSAT